MCTFLDDVKEAIRRIDSKYFLWKDFTVPDEELYKMQERVFCYEFYHQFRKIMEQDTNYSNFIFNAEIQKYAFEKTLNAGYKYPDFVLHYGQDNVKRQELVIEVKTSEGIKDKKNLQKDIEKLVDFTTNNAYGYFSTGIFIVVNMSTNELKKELKSIVGKFDEKKLGKIWCIGVTANNYFPIKELIY